MVSRESHDSRHDPQKYLDRVLAGSRLSLGDYRLPPRLALLSLLIRLSAAGHLLQAAAETFRVCFRLNLPPNSNGISVPRTAYLSFILQRIDLQQNSTLEDPVFASVNLFTLFSAAIKNKEKILGCI